MAGRFFVSRASTEDADRPGRNAPFFIPAGAEAYLRDLPDAKLVRLAAGHFVLDENTARVASEIAGFFAA